MYVLIACEESQRSCIAFRNRGFEAYSCDIQPCSGGHPEWHIEVDGDYAVLYLVIMIVTTVIGVWIAFK